MKLLLNTLAALVAASMLTHTLAAAELGDAAAPLKISDWIKGKSVDLAAVKGKQIVVVEFWATWCPPCRQSIPHLTEMQKKFKDVIFIGITDEDPKKVKSFVEKMSDKMDYVVAVDKDQATSKGYMEAFGIEGIPNAFIVDKEGKVVWQGHPMDGLDSTLKKVVAGNYKVKKSPAKK